MENIFFDVDQLPHLTRTEQAQCLEQAARRIDDIQRTAANDSADQTRVDQQRKYLVEMQY